MLKLAQSFAQLLDTIHRPGIFFASGRINIFLPRIQVAGVGTLSLPLLPAQAAQLAAVAEQAPYGRGPDTLVDTDVRRTWQINANQVKISASHWPQTLTDIVDRCATALGVRQPITAELYKVLLYDTGGFFLPHRDTEKAPGMFATLVISLPADFTGGELAIRHGGQEIQLNMASQEPSEIVFAAFYADCQHEVYPVTSGHRLVLIYNLLWQGKGPSPRPPEYTQETRLAKGLLDHWQAALARKEEACPEKLIYPLKHAYTPASISFSSLKGADSGVAQVLIQAAQEASCHLYLALVSIEENGSAENYGSWQHRRYRDDDGSGDYEIGEVFERDLGLSEWRLPDDSRPALVTLPFVEAELCPPDAFENAEPDELNFFEATGNAGATFERSYRRAALVLWPKGRTLDILAKAGSQVSVPWLGDLASRWAASGEDSSSPLWQDAHHLATAIITCWPEPTGVPSLSQGNTALMLESLARLRDLPAITAFVTAIPARGAYSDEDNAALAEVLALLPPEQAADILQSIIVFNAATQISACTDLFERVTSQLTRFTPAAKLGLIKSAETLVSTLPGDPAHGPKLGVWRRQQPITPELICQLFQSLSRLEAITPAECAVAQILAWPETYSFDDLLVPACLQLADQHPGVRNWPPAQRLREACLSQLETRIARPLAPPADYTRSSQIACTCATCRQLSTFLANPLQKTWVFKAPEASRKHVEHSIRQQQCDLDTETLRYSRPYELICTKNQASFERRVAQRQADLKNQARLAS